MKEQNSISIINRSNTTLTGENAQAFPIKLVDGNKSKVRIQYFCFGILASVVLFTIFIFVAKSQVVVVDISGKADNYQEYKLN